MKLVVIDVTLCAQNVFGLSCNELKWKRNHQVFGGNANLRLMKLVTSVVSLSIFCIGFVLFTTITFRADLPRKAQLPSYRTITDIDERKRQFFNFLRPIVKEENSRILAHRDRFMKLYSKYQQGDPLTIWDRIVLKRLSTLYEVELPDQISSEIWETLYRRIDIIPTELALAQSANESAWGRSRFAIKGNAMFGQLSFSREDLGMTPHQRDSGKIHTVSAYPSVRDSVRSYMNNLNTHLAYLEFRIMRAKARKTGRKPDGKTLAAGLMNYSERREAYIQEIRAMIETNRPLMNLETP